MADTNGFVFFPASGERLDFNIVGLPGFSGRLSKAGRRVLLFPKPFEDIEIVQGERVGSAKLARIKHAVATLRGELVAHG